MGCCVSGERKDEKEIDQENWGHLDQQKTAPDPSYAVATDKIPELKPIITAVRAKLGPFVYNADDKISPSTEAPKAYLIKESNSVYVGQWKNGKRQGRGEQYFADGSFYEGYWVNNMQNGRGRSIDITGDTTEGEFFNDALHGNGAYYKYHEETFDSDWPEKNVFKGNFVQGIKCGQGKFVASDGTSYEGEWKDDKRNGKGKYTYSEGRVYEGDWVNDKMHGKGKYTWPDGKYYEGGYVNDLKEGYGVFSWPDGRKYEGQFKAGYQDGEGIYFGRDSVGSPNGKKGVWKEGKREKYLDENQSGEKS